MEKVRAYATALPPALAARDRSALDAHFRVASAQHERLERLQNERIEKSTRRNETWQAVNEVAREALGTLASPPYGFTLLPSNGTGFVANDSSVFVAVQDDMKRGLVDDLRLMIVCAQPPDPQLATVTGMAFRGRMSFGFEELPNVVRSLNLISKMEVIWDDPFDRAALFAQTQTWAEKIVDAHIAATRDVWSAKVKAIEERELAFGDGARVHVHIEDRFGVQMTAFTCAWHYPIQNYTPGRS